MFPGTSPDFFSARLWGTKTKNSAFRLLDRFVFWGARRVVVGAAHKEKRKTWPDLQWIIIVRWEEGKRPVCIFEISRLGPGAMPSCWALLLGPVCWAPVPVCWAPVQKYWAPVQVCWGDHLCRHCLVDAWVIVAFAKCKYEMTLDCVCYVSSSKCNHRLTLDIRVITLQNVKYLST